MGKVRSKDGTQIAFDRSGQGPTVILVDGALSSRAAGMMPALAEQLAPHLTAFVYDRRGRGESTDTPPYAVEREAEDIDALIQAAGGSACVYGISSGAVLALQAAARLKAITRLALYEPPFVIDGSRPPVSEDIRAQIADLLASGRRGDAVELFMAKAVGVPQEYLAPMRQQPSWPAMETAAPTLLYDLAVMGESMRGRALPAELTRRAAAISAPTLLIAGGDSPVWMQNAARAAAQAVPGARFRILEGQTHAVAAEAIAPLLIEFFNPALEDGSKPDLTRGI
jgi:pimeloyl-ACP methyl ester carboxylesterase